MKRRLFALLLALCLGLGLSCPAGAAGVEELFPSARPFPGYRDVDASAWYADDARICYETGLLEGDKGMFSPERTMNLAQAATLAARIQDILAGGDGNVDAPQGQLWYRVAVDRMKDLAQEAGDLRTLSRLSAPLSPATRADFFSLLALAIGGKDLLEPVNTVDYLPDSDDPQVLAFYRAGILDGKNKYGSFRGALTLRRSEAAAMAARLVRPELRLKVSLTPLPDLCRAAGVLPETVFFRGAKQVTALEYLTAAYEQIAALEEQCRAQELEFSWNLTLDGVPLTRAVKENTLSALGVTADSGTEDYRALDLQVFYSRYLDLTAG